MARLIKTSTELEGHVYERTSVIEGEEPIAWTTETELTVVGKDQPRVDGHLRVTGRAKYTSDVRLPGMLYAVVLRSPHAHARIRHIDTSRATAFPGVRAVISRQNAGDYSYDDDPLFSETVHYAGDEVAALAADNEYIARDALSLIEVNYDLLPVLLGARPDFLDLDLIKNPEYTPAPPRTYQRGNVEDGFAKADLVLEETFHTGAAFHSCMETHGAIASWDDAGLTVWESTQSIYRVKEDLAEVFGLPLNRVRVICEYMGSGFGSKQYTGKWSIIAALLAHESGRPVKLTYDRYGESVASGYRAPTVQHLKIGALRDGTLTAIELTAAANVGGYGGFARSTDGPVQVMYACPNVHTALYGLTTNMGIQRSFRGPGYVEGAFPLESLIDELAFRLGIDPVAIRMKNYAHNEPTTGRPYSAKYLDRCYQTGVRMIGWESGLKSAPGTGRIRRGFGMASQTWGGGGGPPAYAWVRINQDASVEVITGSQDIGTGTRTAFAQIAAEEFGLDPDDIAVRVGDTEKGPYAPVSWGSMTVSSVGPAVRQAAADALSQLRDIVAASLNLPVDQVKIRNGRVFLHGRDKADTMLSEITGNISDFTILGKGARGPNQANGEVRTFGAQFAEVEVDTVNGEVKVRNVVTVHDIGRVVNPLVGGNQCEGAVIQGIGYALTEGRVVDGGSGVVLNPNLEEYYLPTALDIGKIDYAFTGVPDGQANGLGVKGLGEPAMIPTAPAVANALARALNARFLSIPVTRSKILEALHNRTAERKVIR